MTSFIPVPHGAGDSADIPLPDDCASVRFECPSGNAQVSYQFPGEIMQFLTLGEGTGPRDVEVPAGAGSVRVTRFDDDERPVRVTLVLREGA
jgi:hypothetical protein